MKKSSKIAIAFMIVTAFLLSGCSSDKSKDATAVVSSDVSSGIVISEKDDFFTPETIRNLEKYLEQGVTIRDGLKKSGIVTFAKDGSIHSISQVSLSPAFIWGLELNDKKLGKDKLDTILKENDEIGISIEPADPKDMAKDIRYSVLKLNGGNLQPGISHTYILPYSENESVREMLLHTDIVKLSKDKRMIETVNGYVRKPEEKWAVKVNGKELGENGFDMKLTPRDEVEIKLERA
ncbi:hypothetical protein [Paenibacillus azoreducens]|uniref:Lipoprotein n=1 Tax=Paenibacillus azoreducens TaxID=116718 RepID=A0A919YDL7_9BACL|nr:hypothetical protein [Paenibacillus azoreducens]GIO47738.1 hypothetical protein J34TS1_25030 [Paenibacillus azoreducens]